MTRRMHPAHITKLVAVQRAGRAQADSALAEARAAEARAAARMQIAQHAEAESHDAWLRCLTAPSFAPEFSHALAALVLQRQAEAVRADDALRLANDDHAASRDTWCMAEARTQLAERALGRARRDARKLHDEKRLGEIADRVTFHWIRA